MAVQVWIGEKPEHPNERRAIMALARGLAQLDGLYLLLANFNVGGRALDLVIIKNDAIFIIELKHCDGRVIGSVNGPWFVEGRNGERKKLNPGRRNPYNQVISYFHAFTNFLNASRNEFLSEQKASSVDFRTCRRVVVIAPVLAPDSEIETDWKVDLRGLDELPTYLVTERSTEINLSDEEMIAIPQLLNCTRWNEINTLISGVIADPTTLDENAPPPSTPLTPVEAATAAEVPAAPVSSQPFNERLRQTLSTTTGRVAALLGAVAVLLLALLLARPPVVAVVPPDQPVLAGATDVAPLVANGALAVADGAFIATSCDWLGQQAVGKRWDRENEQWISVAADDLSETSLPEVVIALERVRYCDGEISLTWSLRNNTIGAIELPLSAANIAISDGLGNQYEIDDEASRPAVLRVPPGGTRRGTALVPRAISQSAQALLVQLSAEPFGEASFVVPLVEP